MCLNCFTRSLCDFRTVLTWISQVNGPCEWAHICPLCVAPSPSNYLLSLSIQQNIGLVVLMWCFLFSALQKIPKSNTPGVGFLLCQNIEKRRKPSHVGLFFVLNSTSNAPKISLNLKLISTQPHVGILSFLCPSKDFTSSDSGYSLFSATSLSHLATQLYWVLCSLLLRKSQSSKLRDTACRLSQNANK